MKTRFTISVTSCLYCPFAEPVDVDDPGHCIIGESSLDETRGRRPRDFDEEDFAYMSPAADSPRLVPYYSPKWCPLRELDVLIVGDGAAAQVAT